MMINQLSGKAEEEKKYE